jgi:hypothetical protein
MERKSSAVKAIEKALQKLKIQESTASTATETPVSKSKPDTKNMDNLLKESRKFGEGLLAYFEEERNRAQRFLDSIQEIESGTYTPRRGGRRPNAGRKAE